MARTYKRDSRGRFASGSGGGSTGKPAAKKPAAGKPAAKKPAAKKPAAGKAAASKPASNGRRGPRGGKVGTKAQQAKAKREQQARSKQFASKKQATSAQKAWKAASRGARMSEKGAARKVVRAAAQSSAKGQGGAKAATKPKSTTSNRKAPRVFGGKATVGRKAKAAYKKAVARSKNDQGWKGLDDRRVANRSRSIVRNMERNRSTVQPSAPPDSPRRRQVRRQLEISNRRTSRARRNLTAAMMRESEGPGSRASRSASVAKRALDIYSGKVDPKKKTRVRLTRTVDTFELQKRIKKIKDNTAKSARRPAKPRKRS